jgi:hypothetical protein
VNTWLLDKFAEMQIPENCCVLLSDTVRQQACEPCVVGVVRVMRVCSLSRACVTSLEPVCSTLFTCLMGIINPIRGGPLHFEAGFVLEIIRRIVSMHPEHGDRNAGNGIVFIASRLDLFNFLLNILESPTGIGRIKEPNVVRAEAIEILNMLETVRRLCFFIVEQTEDLPNDLDAHHPRRTRSKAAPPTRFSRSTKSGRRSTSSSRQMWYAT